MNDTKMLAPKEVTKKLNISYATLLRRVKAKEIPFVKVGSKLLFPLSYFEKLEKQAYSNVERSVDE